MPTFGVSQQDAVQWVLLGSEGVRIERGHEISLPLAMEETQEVAPACHSQQEAHGHGLAASGVGRTAMPRAEEARGAAAARTDHSFHSAVSL